MDGSQILFPHVTVSIEPHRDNLSMLTHNIHYCQSELIILDILWMLFYNVLNVFGWIIIIFCYSSYNSQTQLQSNLSSGFCISLDLNESPTVF